MNQAVKKIVSNWAKSCTYGTIWKYRQATWSNRCLPDFIIIGAQKCGTTSMYANLRRHPQILPSFKKEVHFFDGGSDPSVDDFEKGEPWYCSHFPLRKRMKENQKTFEASPLYLFNPLAPQRIAHLIPKVKLICLLRNPTERAISHYLHEKRKQRELFAIDEALRKEQSRLKPIIGRNDYKSKAFIHQSYKSRGLYKEQLERFFKYFPREQMLVICAEEFFAEPDMCLRRVFEFVGVDPGYEIADLSAKNVASNRESVPPGVYDYLDGFFGPHNQELFRMIGENYPW